MENGRIVCYFRTHGVQLIRSEMLFPDITLWMVKIPQQPIRSVYWMGFQAESCQKQTSTRRAWKTDPENSLFSGVPFWMRCHLWPGKMCAEIEALISGVHTTNYFYLQWVWVGEINLCGITFKREISDKWLHCNEMNPKGWVIFKLNLCYWRF